MIQPPIAPEDTQPRAPRWHDTQPNLKVVRQRWWKRHGRWIALFIIGITSFSLMMTLAILFQPMPAPTVTTISSQTVTLHINGNTQVIQTGANTIAEVLGEQEIEIAPDDAVSHQLNDPVTDGMTITVSHARDVTLIINGEQTLLRTPFENPLDILNNANISLSDDDQIWLDNTSATLPMLPVWTVPVTQIEIETAITITIVDNGNELTIRTATDTVGDALFQAGISLYLTDSVSPSPDSLTTQDMRVTIQRAIPIQLVVDGVTVDARTNADTVDGVLSEMNAPLFGLDYVLPDGLTPITEKMTIEIVRVTEEVIATTETIPYETTYQSDASMNLDQKATIQTGHNGTQEIRTRIRYENGIEINRTPESTVITQQTQNAIIAYGTNIVMNVIDTPDGPREYWRTFRVYATSYHPEALGGDDVTAIGAKLEKGVIGADPNIIPWRTQMFVPGYGIGRMADTGGARSSSYWIDLGYSDDDWKAWHRYVDVYLLAPVPDEINYLLPEWTALR